MARSSIAIIGSLALALVASAADDQSRLENGAIEATSLMGRPLYALPDSDGSVAAAKASLAANPRHVGLRLKLARAQAAKRQYKEAIATCSEGLRYAPKNAELYLEKGHRELGLREFR